MNEYQRNIFREISLLLPPLSGEQAYFLAETLEGITSAIWRKYGDDMANFQGRVFPDKPSPPGSVAKCDCPDRGTKIDF